jgi:hypothetical protein
MFFHMITSIKRVLNRSLTRFEENLETTSILDLLLERDFLSYSQVRDIQVSKSHFISLLPCTKSIFVTNDQSVKKEFSLRLS